MSTEQTKSGNGGALDKLNGGEVFTLSTLLIAVFSVLIFLDKMPPLYMVAGLAVFFMGVYPVAFLLKAISQARGEITSAVSTAADAHAETTKKAIGDVTREANAVIGVTKAEAKATVESHVALVTAGLNEVATAVNAVSRETTGALATKLDELPVLTAQELMVRTTPEQKATNGKPKTKSPKS